MIEFTPGAKDLAYGKVVIWVRVDDLMIVKYSMHDTAGRQEKVLTLGDMRNVGPIPTAVHMEMQNIESGSHTIVDFTEIKYDTSSATTCSRSALWSTACRDAPLVPPCS